LNGLVSALGSSPRVQKFAADRAAIAQQKAADAATADAAWTNTIGDCGTPKDSHSCDSLKAWTASESRGAGYGGDMAPADRRKLAQRREQAAQLLAAAAPALQSFTDDETWAKVDLAACQNAALPADCSSVQNYVHRFPNGAHVPDATAAIDQGNNKLAAINDANDRKAASQQHAAAGRAQQDQCKAKCSSDTCIAYTDASAKAQCVSQCTAGCS
jgi:hypothetical protein